MTDRISARRPRLSTYPRLAAATLALGVLGACDTLSRLDLDLRDNAVGALDTSEAALRAAADRPEPDANGLITYPTYQVAVARRGDTVTDVAQRIGADAAELARFNGVTPDARLNRNAVLALPSRVNPAASGGQRDIASIAGQAIDRASASQAAAPLDVQGGAEPVRHQVARGETAFSIARLYGVTPRSLADWNGLGPDLAVREGQFLLIPLVIGDNGSEVVAEPGSGSETPLPPSASSALPDAVEAQSLPESPQLDQFRTEESAAASQPSGVREPVTTEPEESGSVSFQRPVNGSVREGFSDRNEGIDYNAPAGAPVGAAADGRVAAITRDTDQVPILVLRHGDGLLTVYANIQDIRVDKGDTVRKGQRIASVGEGDFLHFELRQGLDPVDPSRFLR
ncbi:peptidoglycan DD-metalloendopeptidase family protein [Jannaschia aquimarina]|uniref:NlpD protein n=1 Tax=Jannaschia aquimarina TaxID=935700 RepID=A0A0D1D3G3_9RHOB|nr:peptidoglycan DD-metalloendopeptidase family protein [Jannaschia aquimarina]KIT14663.1 Murein hydrolase activator NlpD precursor [Jannaschia aquimarina]SNT37825.1 Murein DD-endopeptidase MepM and murein hydrolase activator NlpD, contain LysM domain [Jannaschia aquimarina]